MTVSTQRIFAPKINTFNTALTPPHFSNSTTKLDHDPYAALQAGRIGGSKNQMQPGQVNRSQLEAGLMDARRYADALRQRTGLIYTGSYYLGNEKYPPISSEANDTLQQIIIDADYLIDRIARYTSKQISDAWNKMNSLVVLLRKQELASK